MNRLLTFLTPVTRHLTPQWLRRNLTFFLILAAVTSAVTTYITITGSTAPLGLKPKRVLTLMFVNIGVLAVLVGIVALRIYNLWNALRIDKVGSKLQKRILVLFSLVTIIPTLVVTVFSALFFNYGIQTWFNERVQTVVSESLAVAEAYLGEHRDNIRGDAIAMARDLSREGDSAISDPQGFNQAVSTQALIRELTEAVVFQHGRIIAQGRLSFALAFERVPQELIDRASRGEVVLLTDDEDKVRALVKLEAPAGAYLLVGRLVDSKVIEHMQSTQGAVSEYNTLKSQLGKLQISFLMVFITLALLLLLGAVWYGMVFAARLTTPISGLVQAAERVRGGDFAARVDDAGSRDELGKLGRAFNRMTEQLEAQRGDLIEANRRLDERRRFSETVLKAQTSTNCFPVFLSFWRRLNIIRVRRQTAHWR
ncbi:MAG: HAMP domain-containing protein [Alphaproteobacteria bacterium]|nr:HAMP domain-containing protein [Alphaproteobacteria bacterium]